MKNVLTQDRDARPSRTRAFGWLAQRLTGLGLVLFLALHFWVQHMPAGFLDTAEEYLESTSELAATEPGFAEAIAEGKIKPALQGEHVISSRKVQERLANPLWMFVDVMLLLFAVMHGMNGLNNVLEDYVQRPMHRKIVLVSCWAAVLLLSVQGVVSILAVGNWF